MPTVRATSTFLSSSQARACPEPCVRTDPLRNSRVIVRSAEDVPSTFDHGLSLFSLFDCGAGVGVGGGGEEGA